MMIVKPINLDYTLGCGQVFRWKRQRDWWVGVIDSRIIELKQKNDSIKVRGNVDKDFLCRYFRADDQVERIYCDISRDNYISNLVTRYAGLRLIRQDPWECSASFILATYANIPRIEKMIENLCITYGEKINDQYYSFPTPESIVRNERAAHDCGLGFRCKRFVQFAKQVYDGNVNFDELREMGYEECIRKLKKYEGIGDKVADCIALFSLDKLEAFPIDVRIARAMKRHYGVEGNYKKVSAFCRSYFGEYAGYAQEFIYLSEARRDSG